MSAFEKQSVSWGDTEQAPHNHHEPSVAAILGGSVLMGAALFPSYEVEAQQPVQPPAVVRQVEHEAASYVEFSTVEQVIQKFDKDTHIYISKIPGKSELPITTSQLKELSDLLAGKPYYLVVIGDASDTNFETKGGTRLHGLDAAKTMLGQRLFDHPEFASIKDERVSPALKSANLFILTFNPRDWFMSTSDMYEQFGVKDEDNWGRGQNFGQIAPQYFRNGRVSSGISETISRIEAQFNATLDRSLESAKQLKVNADLAIRGATDTLQEYKTRLATLNGEYRDRTGDLLHPGDLPRLAELVETAKRAEAKGSYATVIDQGNSLRADLLERIKNLVEYPGAGTRLEGLAKDLELAHKSPFAQLSAGEIKKAEGLLNEAQARWARGESGYQTTMSVAAEGVSTLKNSLAYQQQEFDTDGEAIRDLIGENSQLQKSKYASVALTYFETNKEKLERAQTLWSEQNFSYRDVLREAQVGVGKAALEINKAEEAALRSERLWTMFYSLASLGTLIAGAAGYVVNSQVRRRGEEAQAKLAKLQRAMGEKQEGLEGLERLQERALNENGSPITFTSKSESESCALKAREAIEKLWLFQIVANQEVTDAAAGLIRKGGILSSQNYVDALAVLTSKPIEFSDKNRERVLAAFSEHRTGLAALSVPIEELQDFQRSMEEIDQEYIRLAEIAQVNLDLILESRGEMDQLLRGTEEHVAQIETHGKTLAEYVRGDQHAHKVFDVSDVIAKIVVTANERMTALKAEQQGDPVTVGATLAELETVLAAVRETLNVIVQKRVSAVPSIRTVEQQFLSSGLTPEWIATELDDISQQANQFLRSALKAFRAGETHLDTPDFEELFSTLHTRIDEAVALNGRRTEDVATAITEVKELVNQTRLRLAATLNVDSRNVLTEKEANPDDKLGAAVKNATALRDALNEGELKDGTQAIADIEEALTSVRQMVKDATSIVEQRSDVLVKLAARRTAIDTNLAAARETMGAMKERYTKAALRFVESDEVQEGADDTVDNNIKETEQALKKATDALQRADSGFQKGKILEAGKDLLEVRQQYVCAELRILEITEKNENLNIHTEENRTRTTSARALYEQLVKTANDDRTVSEETLSHLEDESSALLSELEKKQDKVPNNPLTVQEVLEKVEESLQHAERGINADRAAYQTLESMFPQVRGNLEKALNYSGRIETDNIADSRDTDEAQQQLELLRDEFLALEESFSSAERGQWDEFSRDLDRISAGIVDAHNTIHNEAKAAKRALEALENAASIVKDASRWTGRHSISIDGDPGLVMLKKARALLQQGVYDDATSWAHRSYKEASEAISSAEERVQLEDNRIAEEERAEAARARARRARASSSSSDSWSFPSSSNDSWGGFGGSSSGGSFPDFGSGGSSSSFSSDSGSGGSSVGW